MIMTNLVKIEDSHVVSGDGSVSFKLIDRYWWLYARNKEKRTIKIYVESLTTEKSNYVVLSDKMKWDNNVNEASVLTLDEINRIADDIKEAFSVLGEKCIIKIE